MPMTNSMDYVCYEDRNFNLDPGEHLHPAHITERHFYYQLTVDKYGCLVPRQNAKGVILKTPRPLRDVCVYNIVTESYKRPQIHCQYMPSNLYPVMLMEALYQREAHAIQWLVSTWPRQILRVSDIFPPEDYLTDDYLTVPLEDNKDMCLIDCFVIGLLKLKPESNLKCLDLTSFDRDRKLSRELCRLPILWMEPKDRDVDRIHEAANKFVDVSKDKVQKFLNRIQVVYSNIDDEFKHGNNIDPVLILLDMKMGLDDVPLGLSLQHLTPFTFSCSRLWMRPIPGVVLLPANLSGVVDTSRLTHFELEYQDLPVNDVVFNSLLEALSSMFSLVACSLPSSIDVTANQEMTSLLNEKLVHLQHLRRLCFSYCNLKGQLSCLLGNMTQMITYLNLEDCRLMPEDLEFLMDWEPITSLRELNLSCNNLSYQDQILAGIFKQLHHVVCFSVSFSGLNMHSMLLIANGARMTGQLKVLCMQSYTPLPDTDVLDVLSICTEINTLQKVLLFPETYAFPGDNDLDRHFNKLHLLSLCYQYLDYQKRCDIELM